MSELIGAAPARSAVAEAVWVASDVTAAVGIIAATLPPSWHATLVGFVFLGATWALVWRHDDARVRRAGLALGGLVIPGSVDWVDALRSARTALMWAVGLMAIVAAPYFIGWRFWWAPKLSFSLGLRPADAAGELLNQLIVIALPEDAFYPGYLQSQLDEAWRPRWRVLGARVGPGLLGAAAIFALGHIVTVQPPARFAVFFPALLFGWLLARTGGIGATCCFHATCNVYAELLGNGYGVY